MRAIAIAALAAALAAVVGAACAQTMASIPNARPVAPTQTTTGYRTVAAALAALPSRPGVRMGEVEGWTIAEERAQDSVVMWSFTPPGHPAHPSAVKRVFTKRDGGLLVELIVQCEAAKPACAGLSRDFDALTAQMMAAQRAEQDAKAAAQTRP